MMESIVIRLAANGFIVSYMGDEDANYCQQDYIAYDITDACEVVRDILRAETHNVDMSHVVTDTVPHA
jgi:hypothetical protein